MARRHKHQLLNHRNSFARLSRNPAADTCIVFVHGFLGQNRSTWGDFIAFEPDDWGATGESLGNADLYFFDYPAQNGFLVLSGGELRSTLSRVFPTPDPDLFNFSQQQAGLVRTAPWLPYRRLVLVGHSLGAVVIRQCIADEFRLPKDERGAWLEHCEAVLFGSAQIGFEPSGWKAALTLLLEKPAIGWIPTLWRAYNDLQIGCQALVELRETTEALAETNPEMECLKARLMYGDKEDVVRPGMYRCDYPINVLQGHTHTSVCKPHKGFLKPADFVAGRVAGSGAS